MGGGGGVGGFEEAELRGEFLDPAIQCVLEILAFGRREAFAAPVLGDVA